MSTVQVQRWKTELPLLALVILASIVIWVIMALSVVGIIYTFMIMAFLLLSHLAFIAFIRGSAVRISPEQFPELHRRIVAMATNVGLKHPPEAYIMQAGGALNALATKLFSSNFIVLYSDLLEACEGNEAARDMIIGHELGHIRAGHLRFIWFMLPGLMMPFLGSAYSQAREYTCDRYGMAVVEDKIGALRGLAILSAGAKYGPRVDLRQFVKQRENLNSGMMTIGKWMGTHPPLSERILALDNTLDMEAKRHRKGPILATIAIITGLVVPVLVITGMWSVYEAISETNLGTALSGSSADLPRTMDHAEVEKAAQKIRDDLDTLAIIIIQSYNAKKEWPSNDIGSVAQLWKEWRPERVMPLDPFDYQEYGYWRYDSVFAVYSCGADGEVDTKDDITKWVYDSERLVQKTSEP